MPEPTSDDLITQLEAENVQLRKIHHDERRHLEALRAEVRELHVELARVSEERDELKARLRVLAGESVL